LKTKPINSGKSAESTTTLRKLGITVRDDSEIVWNVISERDLDSPLPVHPISVESLNDIEVRGESLMEVYQQNSTSRQRNLVTKYVKDLNSGKMSEMERTIIFSGDLLLDGYHRSIAAILAEKPLLFVDVEELQS